MYDELVKRLRKEAGEWCANCFYKCGDNVCGAPYDRKKDCDVYTKLHSADAIEKLSAYVRQIEELRKDGYYLQKTKMMTYGQATMTMPLPEPPKEE